MRRATALWNMAVATTTATAMAMVMAEEISCGGSAQLRRSHESASSLVMFTMIEGIWPNALYQSKHATGSSGVESHRVGDSAAMKRIGRCYK